MSCSISAFTNKFTQPNQNSDSTGFSLSNFKSRPTLMACVGGPADIHVHTVNIERALESRAGSAFPEMILGAPRGENHFDLDAPKEGNTSLVEGDKLNLANVIKKARELDVLAADGTVGITAEVDLRQVVQLQIIAKLTGVAITANRPNGMLVDISPDGTATDSPGRVGTSAGTRSMSACGGGIRRD